MNVNSIQFAGAMVAMLGGGIALGAGGDNIAKFNLGLFIWTIGMGMMLYSM